MRCGIGIEQGKIYQSEAPDEQFKPLRTAFFQLRVQHDGKSVYLRAGMLTNDTEEEGEKQRARPSH